MFNNETAIDLVESGYMSKENVSELLIMYKANTKLDEGTWQDLTTIKEKLFDFLWNIVIKNKAKITKAISDISDPIKAEKMRQSVINKLHLTKEDAIKDDSKLAQIFFWIRDKLFPGVILPIFVLAVIFCMACGWIWLTASVVSWVFGISWFKGWVAYMLFFAYPDEVKELQYKKIT